MRSALLFFCALAAVSCQLPVVVGSINCAANSDCDAPTTVCGVDARCVAGCATTGCFAGASCVADTGECVGGIFGTTCTGDPGCDPPEVVCNAATSSCDASCVLTGSCPVGLACDRGSGRCCDPDAAGCSTGVEVSSGCQDDDDCMAPAMVCQANACVEGCAVAGCTAPLACDAQTGHCAPTECARDSDCDDNSTCKQSGSCVAVDQRSFGECMGGTPVTFECAMQTSPSGFVGCAGKAGADSCPYCIDDSCFQPGLCVTNDDCDRGLVCTSGLCIAQAPVCPTIVALKDVVAGIYAVGRAVCVHDKVTSVRSGYDGAIEVRLGSSPYLYIDVLAMYEAAGVKVPTVGDEVTVHGVVRWDDGHGDRELLPVDWIGP